MKNLKDFELFTESKEQDILPDGEYTGEVCGCTLTLESGEKYKLLQGVMGCFGGKLSIKEGCIYLLDGYQNFGNQKYICSDIDDKMYLGRFYE